MTAQQGATVGYTTIPRYERQPLYSVYLLTIRSGITDAVQLMVGASGREDASGTETPSSSKSRNPTGARLLPKTMLPCIASLTLPPWPTSLPLWRMKRLTTPMPN